jgi:hypothetical protein
MKNIKIDSFSHVDYNILLKVVAAYCREYQRSRDKRGWEKDVFDLNNTVYFLELHKHPVQIEIENHWKPFFVKVTETSSQYRFKIWYAR